MRLTRLVLRVRDAPELAGFHTGLLGMRLFAPGEPTLLGYDRTQCLLELREADVAPYSADQTDLYWKIGITLRDLDAADRIVMPDQGAAGFAGFAYGAEEGSDGQKIVTLADLAVFG